MMKALKLFAKNHQQLEKATDPNKGQHRRVLSSDGRTVNNNIAASTYEKSGGSVPIGPKYINQMVEKELEIYKKEIEEKFKTSYRNNTYKFPRRNQQNFCRTGPDRSVEREPNVINANVKNDMQVFFNNQRIIAGEATRQARRDNLLKENIIEHQKTFDKSKHLPDNVNLMNHTQVPKKMSKTFMNSPQIEKTGQSRKIKNNLQHILGQQPTYIHDKKEQHIQNLLPINSYHKTYHKSGNASPITHIEQGQIVIHKPIVIQFQNKKITFVNNDGGMGGQQSKSKPKVSSFYKSAAQRSPRNSNNGQNLNQGDDSYIIQENMIRFKNDLIKRKRQRSHQKGVVSSSQNKNQVNQILHQILTFDGQSPRNSSDYNFVNNERYNPKKVQQNFNGNMNFGNPIISKTQDQRNSQHYVENNVDYQQNSSKDISLLLNNLNQIFTQPNHRPKIGTGNKIILNTLAQKQNRKSSEINARKQQQQQNVIYNSTTNTQNRQRYTVMDQMVNNYHQEARNQTKSNMTGGSQKPVHKIQTVNQSLRNSLAQNPQQLIHNLQQQYHKEENFPKSSVISSRLIQTKMKKKQKTSVHSPARENTTLTTHYDGQEESLQQQRLIISKLRQQELGQKSRITYNRKMSTSRV